MHDNGPVSGPPPALMVVPSGIPVDLRALPRFVVWTWAYRDGHWRKPPLRADGQGAAPSNDARAWVTCDDALAVYRGRQLDGIGFAVASDDPFFFVDVDDCRDPRTGAVDPWAERVLARFRHTYQEISPTGTGFKILGRGDPPIDRYVHPIADARPRAKIEVFASLKYTTLTGHRLPGVPPAVRDAQAALDALYAELLPNGSAAHESLPPAPAGCLDDEAVLDRARNASTGADFCRLFDAGDLSGCAGDPRRGAEVLRELLAVWCGPDRARLARLLRRSALADDALTARTYSARGADVSERIPSLTRQTDVHAAG